MKKKEIQNEEQEVSEIEACEVDYKALSEDHFDKYLRTVAEFDNYKKRMQKEREDIYSFAVCDVMLNIIPAIDNLERAMATAKTSEDNTVVEGVVMILNQFRDALAKIGILEIKTVGESFDPNYHEAVLHIEDDNYDTNTVVEELVKGYKYKDRIIRHSMVKVAN